MLTRIVEQLLYGLEPFLDARLSGVPIHQITVQTPLGESDVADYLKKLHAKVASKGITVGSYPRGIGQPNDVTMTGR